MYADSDSARSLNGTGEVRSRHMYMKFHIQCHWRGAFEAPMILSSNSNVVVMIPSDCPVKV